MIYPGTFDPVTYGHLDLIKRCQKMFDEIQIAVASSQTKKQTLFSIDERVDLLNKCLDISNHPSQVKVQPFSGLLVDYAASQNISTIVRGIRAVSDFEYEFQMALTNRKMNKSIDTIFLIPDESYSYISSRMIKEICAMKGDISHFVPPHISEALTLKLGRAEK